MTAKFYNTYVPEYKDSSIEFKPIYGGISIRTLSGDRSMGVLTSLNEDEVSELIGALLKMQADFKTEE